MDQLDIPINKASEDNLKCQGSTYTNEVQDKGEHHLIRIIKLLKMEWNFIHPTKIGVQFKKFYCFTHKIDNTFEILRFQSADKKMQNIHTAHFSPKTIDLSHYHMDFLKGQMNITVELSLKAFMQQMEPWLMQKVRQKRW